MQRVFYIRNKYNTNEIVENPFREMCVCNGGHDAMCNFLKINGLQYY